MEFISENVSTDETEGRVSVVIEQKIHGWKGIVDIWKGKKQQK